MNNGTNRSIISGAVVFACLALLATGCVTTGNTRDAAVCEKILGVWKYADGDRLLEREYTTEGKCIIRHATTGEIIEVHDYISVDTSTVLLKHPRSHVITEGGELQIEDRFTGRRVTPNPPGARHPIVGTWEYKSKGAAYQRTFTNDGKAALVRVHDGRQGWTLDYEIVSPTQVHVLTYLPNIVLRNGRLLLENSRLAERASL